MSHETILDLNKEGGFSTDTLSNVPPELKEKYDELDKKVKEAEAIIVKFDNIEKKLKDEIADLRNNLFSLMSLFFVIFTFVSLEIQVFSKINDLFSAVVFTVLIGVIMITFLLVFFSFLHEYEKNIFVKWILNNKRTIFGFFIIILVFLYYCRFNINPNIDSYQLVTDLKEKIVDKEYVKQDSYKKNTEEINLKFADQKESILNECEEKIKIATQSCNCW